MTAFGVVTNDESRTSAGKAGIRAIVEQSDSLAQAGDGGNPGPDQVLIPTHYDHCFAESLASCLRFGVGNEYDWLPTSGLRLQAGGVEQSLEATHPLTVPGRPLGVLTIRLPRKTGAPSAGVRPAPHVTNEPYARGTPCPPPPGVGEGGHRQPGQPVLLPFPP